MGNYGIKISKAGYAYDDGDKRLVYNSTYPLLKMLTHGTGTLSISSGSGSKTVYTHSLNYKPMFYVWINYLNIDTGTEIEKLRMMSWRDYMGVGTWSSYRAWATTTTIEIAVSTAYVTSPTLDYIYVVYYDGVS